MILKGRSCWNVLRKRIAKYEKLEKREKVTKYTLNGKFKIILWTVGLIKNT